MRRPHLSAMNALDLDGAELGYLLSLMRAETVSGLAGWRVLPADLEARDAVLRDGGRKLRERGWLTPAGRRGQVHLDDEVAGVAAALVDPELVLSTIRYDASEAPRLCLHYLTGATIVELSLASQRQYRLRVIPGRCALYLGLSRWLALDETSEALPPAALVADPELLRLVERLATAGQLDGAAAALPSPDAGSASLHAFLMALASAARGSYDKLAAARTRGAEILAERKATLLRHAGAAWLLARPDPGQASVKVEAVRHDTLARRIAAWLEAIGPGAPAGPE
jgi:hypothetical protein